MGKIGIYVRTSVDKENTSIEQQIELGKKFCKKNKFDFEVYEDVGKSGFKIVDEKEPFKNRPGMTKLIEDIENKNIDKVWVHSFSRLGRNDFTGYLIRNIFIKNKITVYEDNKPYDMNDPMNQMIQGIVSQITQYERQSIVKNSIRGVHDTINRGIHSFNTLYGYERDGIQTFIFGEKQKSFIKWKSVKSEIENLKYIFERYVKGDTIYSILETVFKKKITEKNRSVYSRKITRFLRQFVYTGYQLNIEGRELLNNYLTFKTDSIKELIDKKYYVKSLLYPIQIVSIENWIKITEKLQGGKLIYKDKMRKTDTKMLTGIMSCPYCELRYYMSNDKGFIYYKHFPKKLCGQLPKSVRIEKLDRYFEVFFFYFYLVYDDTKVLIEESQRLININQLEIKEKIRNIVTENKRLEKQVDNFQTIYETSQDIDKLNSILEKEKNIKVKIEKNVILVGKLKNEYEELEIKFDKDKLELTYYDVKETIINFLEKMNVEEKRTSLVKIIKCCQLFGKYIVIDTGNLLFIFNLDKECVLPEEIYNKFKKDKNFKNNFMNSSKVVDKEGMLRIINDWKYHNDNYQKKGYKQKELSIQEIRIQMKNLSDYISVRVLGDFFIQEIVLKSKTKIDIKNLIETKLDNVGIKYNLSSIEKVISFTDLL